MKIKNETEIQLMKILFKTSGKKPTKNITSQRAYPHGVEMKYYRQLQSYFKPLTDYVKKYINENMEPLLRGDDKEIKLDAIPGDSYRNMIYSLENWLSIYMPDISNTPESANNNVIFAGLGKTADEAMAFSEKEFKKIIDKGIHVNVPTSAPWWDDMKASWAEDNYTLITSNAKRYVEQINVLTEQAIVNGMSPGKLTEEIMKATESLSDKHCKLLARDQMGKLNGQITQAQMQEIGLDLYVWSTSMDDRVRESHALMEGLLCRWDDASVCSYDNGKTWVERPSGAVDLHPGQDIQCRCSGLAFYPELVAEMEGTEFEIGGTSLESPYMYELSEGNLISAFNDIEFSKDIIKQTNSDFNQYLKQITDDDIRKYIKSALGNNEQLKYFSNIALNKMNVPYFMINEKELLAKYYVNEKIIKFSSKSVLKDKQEAIHEIFHAFSSLNRIRGVPLSRQKDFMKEINIDFSNLLVKFKQDAKKLNKYFSDLINDDPYTYLPIGDIIGGKQGKRINSLLAHGPDYWKEDSLRVYDEAFSIIAQSMFDDKRIKVIQSYFPNSYNKLKDILKSYIKGV